MARQRGNKWQADAKLPDGTRVRRNFSTRLEAEEFEHNPTADGSIDKLFEDAYELYWRRSANARTARINMLQAKEFFGPHNSPDVITTPRVREFIKFLRDKGNSEATINRKLNIVGKLCTYMLTQGVMRVKPHIERFKEYEGRVRFFTDDEETSLFAELEPKHHAFCQFLIETGARVSEALAIRWQDITPTHVTFWKTKGNKPRTIPLSEKAKDALGYAHRRLRQGPEVWPIDYNELHYDWNRARARCGLRDDPEAVLHALRHTCASRLVQAGFDLRRLKDWMGHTDIKTTMRYAHLAPDDLAIGAQLLNGRGYDTEGTPVPSVSQPVPSGDRADVAQNLSKLHSFEVLHVREKVRDRPAHGVKPKGSQ